MVIRPYGASDRGAVAALDAGTEVSSVADLRLADGRFSWTESPLRAARVKRHDVAAYLKEDRPPWDEALVASKRGRVIGFAATGLDTWNSRLVLWHMYVDRTARAQGVGRALLRAILDGEQARAAQHLWLETQSDNVPAIRAYERMGFRIVGLDQTLYGDRAGADTAVFMGQPIDHDRRSPPPAEAT